MASGKPYSFMNALTSVPGASKFLSMREDDAPIPQCPPLILWQIRAEIGHDVCERRKNLYRYETYD